jgi:hypothetical protein
VCGNITHCMNLGNTMYDNIFNVPAQIMFQLTSTVHVCLWVDGSTLWPSLASAIAIALY